MKTNKNAISSSARRDLIGCTTVAAMQHANAPSTQPPQPPAPELFHKLEILSEETSSLEHIVSHLIEKLSPIIRPIPQATGNSKDVASCASQAQLSNEVENNAFRIRGCINRLNETIDALAI
jgi:hypothetical protein